jgi:hypothetical protein
VTRRGGPPPAPRALQLDVQREGVVVSWRAAPAAEPGTRYRVLRTRYEAVRVPVTPPPVMANGLPPEGWLPAGAPAGTPESTVAELQVPAEVVDVGTTGARFLVDGTAHPGERYAYEVVAEAGGGLRSPPSNVQVVPDPRPPARLEQLRRAAGRSTALAKTAAMAAVARSRTARAATLRELEKIRGRAPRGSDLRILVDRVERRVRYAGIADGR